MTLPKALARLVADLSTGAWFISGMGGPWSPAFYVNVALV